AVEIGAVAAAEVFDEAAARPHDHARMMPRNGLVGDANVTRGVSTDHDRRAVKPQGLPRILARKYFQERHTSVDSASPPSWTSLRPKQKSSRTSCVLRFQSCVWKRRFRGLAPIPLRPRSTERRLPASQTGKTAATPADGILANASGGCPRGFPDTP